MRNRAIRGTSASGANAPGDVNRIDDRAVGTRGDASWAASHAPKGADRAENHTARKLTTMSRFAVLFTTVAACAAAAPVAAQSSPGIASPAPASVAATAASPAPAASPALAARAADIVAVLSGTKAADAVFADVFLSAVSADQLAALATSMTGQFGPLSGIADLVEVSPDSATMRLVFARATALGGFHLDAAGKVDTFRVSDIVPTGDTAARVAADFSALPGKSGFLVARLGDKGIEPVAGANAATPLAVGSAFKLYVLSALVADIDAGKRQWSDVVALGARSFPSGMMQDWPADAPVTLQTLATLMISISDNTATDTLIRLVGRDAVGARVRASGHADPARMLPLLTTTEAFGLKSGDDARIASYAAADEATQARLLAQWADTLTTGYVTAHGTGHAEPRAIDTVEWIASPTDIARAFDMLRRQNDRTALAILGVAPHMAEASRAAWDFTGYKGGSEVGVIALNWLLRDKQGQWYAVTGSWNDPAAAVDTGVFELLMARAVGLATAAAAVD